MRKLRFISAFLAVNMMYEICFPSIAYALTGGPSQPEVQSFEPVGTTEMVDMFSGDFTYNIPLLDVDGYPINLSYHSGIGMDQEASWTGLGWNINPGVINRNMRGVPDDFDGDEIKKDMYTKENTTYGVNFGVGFELYGIDALKLLKKANIDASLSASIGVLYNNYKGIGFETSITPSLSIGEKVKTRASLAISSNTQSGLTISPTLSLSAKLSESSGEETTTSSLSLSVGRSYNSRSGIKTLTFSKGLDFTKTKNREDSKGNTIPVRDEKGEIVKDKEGKPVLEKYSSSAGMNNGGSSVGSCYQSYTPQITMPMENSSISGRVTVGGELWGGHNDLFLNGYYASQKIARTNVSKASYGYLYSHNALDKPDVLHDFNREKDGAYSKGNPVLPITNYSYDIYAVSGQGIGGMYRPHRGDLGALHDDYTSSSGGGSSLGGEVGAGAAVKWGADRNKNSSSSSSGAWTAAEGNGLEATFNWKRPADIPEADYEPVYFKNAGEKNVVESDFLAYKRLDKALRPSFMTLGSGAGWMLPITTSNVLLTQDGDERSTDASTKVNITSINSTYRNKRDKRTQNISMLTVDESNFCVDKNIRNYGINKRYHEHTAPGAYTSVSDSYRKSKHIREIVAVNNEGVRYVYGIPAYNETQEEVTFTLPALSSYGDATQIAAEKTKRCTKGLATYDPAMYTNKRGSGAAGQDGYYNATTLPAYAHSYLLTSILGADYVDVNQNGPDEPDLGNYTRINYSRLEDNYQWRTPCGLNEVLYNEGLKVDKLDDKGNFVYGKKETWYVNSIETKNYVAEFHISPRKDGFGVNGPQGGINLGNPLYQLDAIVLYAKEDCNLNGANAVPIKTVHFNYDYSLCQDIQNGNGPGVGKLTLKEVYFTYAKSEKGKFSRYAFSYQNNQPYNIKAYDRWGNFKPFAGCGEGTSQVPTYEYPYVDQSKNVSGHYTADDDAAAWTLNKIDLPSGGTINVTYESDDYAYVQDKRPMQMYKIAGFSGSSTGTIGASLYEYKNWANKDPYNYVFIDVDEPATSREDFAAKYLPEKARPGDDTRYLYFNFLVNLGITDQDASKYEYVRGYAEIEDYGHRSGNTWWVKVKTADVADNDNDPCSPFAKTAWQFARINAPFIVYPESDAYRNPSNGTLKFMKSLVGIFTDLAESIEGINGKLLRKHYCQKVDISHSWVRLTNPTQKKKGGGVRVKKIELTDAWDEMGGISGATETSTYGQEYDYTTVENGQTISSGVASYEPLIGNDENPWRQPVVYEKERALIPNEMAYAEEPFGETFFPSASVGYAKVTVRNLGRTNVTKHATGKTIHEFYTARDFPTIVERTPVKAITSEPDWLSGLFSLETTHASTVLQGFQIELNDMHGKPKGQWVYAEKLNDKEKLISGMQYYYKTDAGNPRHLNNNVRVVMPDGEVQENMLVGVDADMTLDSRENVDYTQQGGVQVNGDLILTMFGPIPIPIPIPSFSSDYTCFRSSVLTRVINRYGLLEKTIIYDEDAVITSENYAYDAETGQVLLSKKVNEYKDENYNLTYPAHWMYEGMSSAYINTGLTLTARITEAGYISAAVPADYKKYLRPGDEVAVEGSNIRYWILDLNGTYQLKGYSPSLLDVVPYAGTNQPVTVKVIRSARKNQQITPVQSWYTQKMPVTTATSGKNYVWGFSASQGIINTNVSTYSDQWRIPCIIRSINDVSISNAHDQVAMGQLFDVINYLMSTSGHGSFNPEFYTNAENTSTFTHSIAASGSPGSAVYYSSLIGTNRSTHNFAVRNSCVTVGNGCRGFEMVFSMPGCNGYPSVCGIDIPYIVKSDIYIDPMHKEFSDVVYTRLELVNVERSRPNQTTAEYWWDVTANVKVYFRERDNPSAPEKFFVRSASISLDPCINPSSYIDVRGFQCVILNPEPNVHPYLSGLRGIWRKKQDFLYLSNRNYTNNIRKDGTFTDYDEFWHYTPSTVPTEPGTWGYASTQNKWSWTSDILDYQPDQSVEIENKDALDRYSAAIFNKYRQAIAVANNARRQEIGYDGFEEFLWDYSGTGCFTHHWNFKVNNIGNFLLDATRSHSGRQSLKLTGSYVSNMYPVENCGVEVHPVYQNDLPCNDCIKPFVPLQGKKYVISGWIYVNEDPNNVDDRNVKVEVSLAVDGGGAGGSVTTIYPSGHIIDGWQRFEGSISVPSNGAQIEVKLYRESSGKDTWYDDIRIHPANGNMKTFVYNPFTMRHVADLDENNYATFYEYDEQGALKRIKKETERGIMTLKEVRSGMVKKPFTF